MWAGMLNSGRQFCVCCLPLSTCLETMKGFYFFKIIFSTETGFYCFVVFCLFVAILKP